MGIGLDIVEIGRVQRVARRNGRFLGRVFSPEEIRYCSSKRRRWQHFAVRFAAKEAVWKALGDDSLSLLDICVSRDGSGRPGVVIRGEPAPEVHLSLSHSDDYAMAVALRWPLPRPRRLP